jgi:hypothetical protein
MAKAKWTDREQLELYVKRVQELGDRPIVKEGRLKYSISGTQDGLSISEPNEEEWRSFILTFRFFIAQKEPTYFHNVRNTVFRRFRPSVERADRDILESYKFFWARTMNGGGLSLKVDEQEISAEEILDVYMNRVYFHNDSLLDDKLKKYTSLAVPLDKMRLYTTIIDLTEAIFNMAGLIQHGFKNDWFDFSEEEK